MITLKLANGNTLHDVRDDMRQVVGYVSDAKNAVGTLEFDIYPKHPAYNSIKAGSTKIRAYRDGMWTHDYTVESVTNDIQLKKHVTATDELQYLERIEVPSYKTGVDGVPQTVSGLFMWLIEYYNARSGGERFAFGQIEGDIIDHTTTLDRSSDSPATVASIVKDKIIDSLGGYVRVRRDNGVLTIDLKADAAGVCHQYIEFGENLVDYADEQDASELYTAITAESKYKDDNGDEVTITLADAPDGDYLTGYVKQGDTVTNTVAAAAYGVRRKHLSFDGIKDVYTLVENCETYISAHCEPVTTVSVTAADLSSLDTNVQSFDVGLYTRVKAAPMGFDAAFECQGAKRSLNDPTDDKYTLGWTWGSLSSINNRKSVETALGIGRLEQASAEIDQTAKDAAQQAQTAQDVASAANINAIDAVTKADSATAEATSASDTAQRAEAISAEAKQTATQANVVAQDASGTASTAASTAAQAGATATEAKGTASQAAADALAAKDKADAATAQVNVTTAEMVVVKQAVAAAEAASNAAQIAAGEARTKADGAQTAAAEAETSAGTAMQNAAAAIATADAATAQAAGAKADAAQVRTDLAWQIKTVTDTMAADYTRKTDLTLTESRLMSEIERSAAGVTSTVAQQYAKKTDLSTVQADLQTKITQNAEAITSTAASVTAVDTKANNAQSAADAAKTAAAKAQTDATAAAGNAAAAQTAADAAAANLAAAEANLDAVSIRVGATEADVAAAELAVKNAKAAADAAAASATTAKTNAAAAKTTADAAKTAAAKAQSAADALGTRVAAAETKIVQNAEAIVLRATKAEVDAAKGQAISDASADAKSKADAALAGAKTYADAQIKVQADRITSSAAATDALGARVSTVEQTASGLSVSLESVEATANSASAAANTAKTNAAAAQTTANTAKTNAAAAKTTANTAKTNAAAAQTTANTAKTNAAAAQTTANNAATAAADAAKTASDYMQYTADGLEVGNKSSGSWSGFRSRMAAGAFQVLDAAGNVLSSFGASVVELGKNSVNSAIKFCAGKLNIEYNTVSGGRSYAGITSPDGIAIYSTDGGAVSLGIESGGLMTDWGFGINSSGVASISGTKVIVNGYDVKLIRQFKKVSFGGYSGTSGNTYTKTEAITGFSKPPIAILADSGWCLVRSVSIISTTSMTFEIDCVANTLRMSASFYLIEFI